MLESRFSLQLRDFVLDVNELSVGDGETVALIGENGAGKSTVLRILSGLMSPSSDRVVLNDTVLFGRCTEDLPCPRRSENRLHVSKLCAVSPHDRARKHCVRTEREKTSADGC